MERLTIDTGEYVAEKARQKGLSLSALARASQVHQARISKIRNGRELVSIQLAIRLGKILGFEAEELLMIQIREQLKYAIEVEKTETKT